MRSEKPTVVVDLNLGPAVVDPLSVLELYQCAASHRCSFELVVVEGTSTAEWRGVWPSAVGFPVEPVLIHGGNYILKGHVAHVVHSHRERLKVLYVVLHNDVGGLIFTGFHVERQARIPVRNVTIGITLHVCRVGIVDIPAKAAVVVEVVSTSDSELSSLLAHSIVRYTSSPCSTDPNE